MADIGRNIKRLRQQKGMSQEALAEKLAVTRQTVSNYELSRSQPDIETLKTLAEVLGTNIETLIYGPRPNPGTPPILEFLTLGGAAAAAGIIGFLIIQYEMHLASTLYYTSGRMLAAFFYYPLAYFLAGMALASLIFPLIKRKMPKLLAAAFVLTNIPVALHITSLLPFWISEITGRIRMWLGFADMPSNALLGSEGPAMDLARRVFGLIFYIIVVPFSKFFLFSIPGFAFWLWVKTKKANSK